MDSDALESLGDPSGQSAGGYWDVFFERVTKKERFEWYCTTEDLVAVIKHALGASFQNACILHGGTGNSELIFDLAKEHGLTRAVGLDVSPVAVAEMQAKQASLHPICDQCYFAVHDVLEPYHHGSSDDGEGAAFDAWVDKGLFDAMMSGFDEECKTKTARLFHTAQEALKAQDKAPYIAITLGEEHILHLLLDLIQKDSSGKLFDCANASRCWGDLEIYELNPPKSSSRPFAFVLRCSDTVERSHFHFHPHAHSPEGQPTNETIAHRLTFGALSEVLDASRQEYAHTQPNPNGEVVDLCLATIQIKPNNTDFDLESLASRIKEPASPYHEKISPLSIQSHEVIPLAFGICMLSLTAILSYNGLEELVDMIGEVEAEDVSSVDVVSTVRGQMQS